MTCIPDVEALIPYLCVWASGSLLAVYTCLFVCVTDIKRVCDLPCGVKPTGNTSRVPRCHTIRQSCILTTDSHSAQSTFFGTTE